MNERSASPRTMLIYDQRAAHRGRRLNAAFLSFREEENRIAFKTDKAAFYDRFELSAEERALVDSKNWDGLMKAGLSVYALGKARGVLDGVKDLLDIGADLRGVEKAELVSLLRANHERK